MEKQKLMQQNIQEEHIYAQLWKLDQLKKDAMPSKEAKTNSDSKQLNAEQLKHVATEVDEDNLITYREFMSAIKGLKGSLYKSILPRTLSFV